MDEYLIWQQINIYLWSKVVCFVLFCFVLFSCWNLPNHGSSCLAKPQIFMLHAWYLRNPNHKSSHCLLAIFGKLLMRRGVVRWWFETVWSYGVEAIDLIIEPFPQWKLHEFETAKPYGILQAFLVLLESSPWVRF